ncbi:MAG: hypothetical protein JKY29_03785 [Gammaproteobacteria bacterium]|nr:hypothetical protein [Gammaproteobacteria bacterium]
MIGAVTNTNAAENEQSEGAADLEFLEFLGQFETDAGVWIDPDSLLAEEFTELLKTSTEAGSDDDSSKTDDVANDKQ